MVLGVATPDRVPYLRPEPSIPAGPDRETQPDPGSLWTEGHQGTQATRPAPLASRLVSGWCPPCPAVWSISLLKVTGCPWTAFPPLGSNEGFSDCSPQSSCALDA